ncbi:MAG: hypothetical protein HYZ46_00945 [Nitrosomonadales bacterium]|nr:hypothetical protein [Nitrosomonadales bacterium]
MNKIDSDVFAQAIALHRSGQVWMCALIFLVGASLLAMDFAAEAAPKNTVGKYGWQSDWSDEFSGLIQ